MVDESASVDRILQSLQERAKELNCLFEVEEAASADDVSLENVLRRIIQAIPPGYQYPDICEVRITYRDRFFISANYSDTDWKQSAPIKAFGEQVGLVEVVYLEQMPEADEGPFAKEEGKLLCSIADRIGVCITHRSLMESMNESRRFGRSGLSDWTAILDLLRRTDQSLLMRVARKMINHLCWSGIKEAEALLHQFRTRRRSQEPDLFLESNTPSERDLMPSGTELADKAFDLAARYLSEQEILSCIHKWIKQDRASFLVNTLENYNTSISQVGDAIQRYQHAAHGEVELTPSTRKGLLVSLVRRFLSDQLEYINVAKNYVEIGDFHQLIHRMIYPSSGQGKVGGKGAGIFLAYQIIQKFLSENELLSDVRTPKTWYLSSDGMHDFVYCNHLEDVFSQKYKEIDEVRQEYPDIIQVFKNSLFSADIIKGLSLALDDLGDRPLIVRSSSLLEDRFGAAFSGKYKSLFLANQGTKQERLNALTDAIAEVYASTFGPDPIQYRSERNLLDFQEGMGILVQEVVGTRVGDYFLPVLAGVAFSHNEFRWSPRIKREDGLVRLVPGLGTRAVDRLGDDYPILVSPGKPGLRANATPEEIARYSPAHMDVINLKTNEFETVSVRQFFRELGDEVPGVEHLISIRQDRNLRQPMLGSVDFEQDDAIVTFEGLLERTPFIAQIHSLLNLLHRELGYPMDIEFACDGKYLYLLQCRSQTAAKHARPAPIPRDLPDSRVLFSANKYVSNGTVPNITHVVYVDPDAYANLGTRQEMIEVGRAVSKLNKLLPKRQFILMGPGRWGSRGDIRLGVPVTYSDISNTAMLIEIARKKGDYTPDLSFGTHFFQDLVEAEIRYLPLYPDENKVLFNGTFLTESENLLAELSPKYASFAHVVRVIDVPRVANNQVVSVLMNADLDEAIAVLTQPAEHIEYHEEFDRNVSSMDGQDWRWRTRMAECVADHLDPEFFGVKAMYLIGSTKNATATPECDIDLLVHFVGNKQQKVELARWFDGWSASLAEMNFLRTGHRTAGLLDVCFISDDDIRYRRGRASKIDAATDAARRLKMGLKA